MTNDDDEFHDHDSLEYRSLIPSMIADHSGHSLNDMR